MNVRKPVDYSAIFEALDTLMAADLPQMELYCEIGRLISGRRSKGAAAAAEYLCGAYPDVSGFSPRNLRRMREFYRSYESAPEVLTQAMTIGWTQNVVKDVTKLLLELGTGFAFLGNQYCINVGGDDFYIDLLFDNLNLRCYVVIELKTGDLKPEYAGQLKNL